MKEEKKENSKIDLVKWFSEINKDSGKDVGGKGANLGEMFNLKIPVPEGFVITAQAYDYFIEKAEIDEKIKEILNSIDYEDTQQLTDKTQEIRNLILNSEFPKDLEEEIIESYETLSANKLDIERGSAADILRNAHEPVFVAVRSSATTEDLAEASFAGQQDTYLNIKGKEKLIEHVKKCFASLFTSRATYYRNKKGFKHEQASLAVVVQKMIHSEKSGVIFSKDPTQRTENIIMEAVWGLGEGIVSGRITPDTYRISRDFEILDKKIEDKKIAIRRDSSGKTGIVNLREDRSKHQVLTEFEIKKLANYALTLEEHYGKPQDIEFAIEGEDITIVQTRPITTLVKKDSSQDKEIKGEIILSGLAASPGIAAGVVKIIKDLKDLPKIKEGDILVTSMTNPDMVVSMQKSAGIITDEGGMTAHAAIVSREMGIPAVVGTRTATEILQDGQEVTVDGYEGKIYSGKTQETQKKEIEPVTAVTKTKIKVIVDLPTFAERAAKTGIKKVGLTRMEGIIAEGGIHPNYFLKENKLQDYEDLIFKGINGISKYFDEMWIRTSDIRTDEFHNLKGAPEEIEANPMLGMHGIRFGLKNPGILTAELKALKKVANQGKTMGILMPQVISVDELKQTKKIIKEIGFEGIKVGIMIETPAAVQLIRDLCNEGINFISFGTNDLTQYILAIDRGNEEVQHLYNELHPAILHQIGYVIRVCKRNNVETSICGQAGSKKEMVKFLVENGIDSITVNADMAKEISDYVAILEQEKLSGTDQEMRQYEVNKEKERIEKDIQRIEEEKEEYLEEHPEDIEELPEKEEEENIEEKINELEDLEEDMKEENGEKEKEL
jgi:pyruvate, water dikinase